MVPGSILSQWKWDATPQYIYLRPMSPCLHLPTPTGHSHSNTPTPGQSHNHSHGHGHSYNCSHSHNQSHRQSHNPRLGHIHRHSHSQPPPPLPLPQQQPKTQPRTQPQPQPQPQPQQRPHSRPQAQSQPHTICLFSSQCTPMQQFFFPGVAYLSPMHDYRPPLPRPRDPLDIPLSYQAPIHISSHQGGCSDQTLYPL